MKNIRIGNDIPFSWTIKRNGAAEDLSNVSCQVKLLNAYGVECEIDNLSISGNKIEGIFRGKHQEKKGVYTLKLIENGGQNNMNTIDHVQCFNLVPHTKDEGGSDCSNLTTSTINITSDILAPANGADGVGIQSITTASSNISGDNNTLTIKLTDGSEYVWYVKNGKDGKDGTNGVGQKGEDGHTPVISSAEALDGSGTTIYADGQVLATIKNGTNGSDYVLTDADKAAIAALIQGGGYNKPNTGIPKTDLAADVQASLGKADTALQSLPNNLVEDANYVHTDNNYTTDEKNEVAKVAELSRKINGVESVGEYSTTSATIANKQIGSDGSIRDASNYNIYVFSVLANKKYSIRWYANKNLFCGFATTNDATSVTTIKERQASSENETIYFDYTPTDNGYVYIGCYGAHKTEQGIALYAKSTNGVEDDVAELKSSVATLTAKKINTSDINDGQVTPSKTTFFDSSESKNVVDWANLDKFKGSLNVSKGASVVNDDSTYYVTSYIELKANTTYKMSANARFICTYSALGDKNIQGNYTHKISSTDTFTTGESDVYVRLQFGVSTYNANTMMLVEGTELPTEYQPYGGKSTIKSQYIPKASEYKILTSIGSSGFDKNCGGQYQLTDTHKTTYGVTESLTITRVLQKLLGYNESNIMAYSGNSASQIFFKGGLACYILPNDVTLTSDKAQVIYDFSNVKAQMTNNLSSAFDKSNIKDTSGIVNGVYVTFNFNANYIKLDETRTNDVTIPAGSMLYAIPKEEELPTHGAVRHTIKGTTGLLLQIGANSEGATNDEIVEYCDVAIKQSGCKWFLVMRQNTQGDLDYSTCETSGTSDLNKASAKLRKKYGSRYIDHMAYMTSKQVLEDMGITPTTSATYTDASGSNSNPLTATQIAYNVPCDFECLATKKVPSSLWHSAYRDGEEQASNSGHFNALGLEALGKYLYKMIKMLNIE